MSSVLVIHEEPGFAARVTQLLESESLKVTVCSLGRDGLAQFCIEKVDLVIAGACLDDMAGLELCRQIRSCADTPILLVSRLHDEELVINGLDLGVNDFAAETVSDRELVARVKALGRRQQESQSKGPLPTIEGFKIDRRARTVKDPEGCLVELTNLEFDLLVLFVANPGVALEREFIFNRVWGQRGLGSSRTIDTHVVTLRNKIVGLKVKSVHGIGYRLDPIQLAA